LVVVLALTLVLTACGGGGGGDDEESAPPETSGAEAFTIWAPDHMKKQVDQVVKFFHSRIPAVQVNVVYDTAANFGDRLLTGEKPDVYLATARQLETFKAEGSLEGDTVDFGTDLMQVIVQPGNPKGIALDAFDYDPTSKVGLCETETQCGRSARAVIANMRMPAVPDTNEPDAATLIRKVAEGQLDAGIVYRSEAAKAVREGRVEVVEIPSLANVETDLQFLVIRPGSAVDQFTRYLARSGKVKTALQDAGLTETPAAPQQ
jgi:molybdate transport system substrate-binding protein